ncbi:Uncharacterised protein [Collinsella intestinalis]|nr:Uncharacterised protein [Collinsella intestinalis]
MSFIFSIMSRLLSTEALSSEYTGASSCWQGATSLCLVLDGMPNDHSSSSRSFM